jgi:hypothetical protein
MHSGSQQVGGKGMSRFVGSIVLGGALVLGGVATSEAQFGGGQLFRPPPFAREQVRVAVRTLLLQVDHLVEDMELDLVREPMSERMMQTAYDVRDEVEHLASSVERGADYQHLVRDFQQFDAQWHRLTRLTSRFALDNRHLQRDIARVSQTDSELHRLLRVAAPVDMREVRANAAGLARAAEHLREDVQVDLRGTRFQRAILAQTIELEQATEHLVASIDRGVDVPHMRQDFRAIDSAWSDVSESLHQLSSMRFDHLLRAAANVATAQGQLRAALGLEPSPNQFTSFRPGPSEVRRTLPYSTGGTSVVVPNGWRVGATPAETHRTAHPGAPYSSRNESTEPGMSLVLGLLFGGDPRDPKTVRSNRDRSDDSDDAHDHEHTRPPVRAVPPVTSPVTKVGGTAPVPPKPIDPAIQSRIEKNLAGLAPDARKLAVAQRTCIVKGELLGEHGVPIKVKMKVNSGARREVFVCCDDCEDELFDHPEKYMSRLGRQD